MLLLAACSGEAETPEALDSGVPPTTDAAVEPLTTCCDLRNDRGERLNYMCGTAINVASATERGYRCWLVQ